MNETKLVTHLRTAIRARNDAQVVWQQKKLDAQEAAKLYKQTIAAVHEIEDELETGIAARPLLDAVEEKADRKASPKTYHGKATKKAEPPVDIPRPKRERPDARVAGQVDVVVDIPAMVEQLLADPAAAAVVERHLADVERAADVPEPVVEPPVDQYNYQLAEPVVVEPNAADKTPVRATKVIQVTEEAVMAALTHALASEADLHRMSLLRRGGGSDEAIRQALAQSWGTGLIQHRLPEDRSYTTRGGSSPAIWLGVTPIARRVPVLAGGTLVNRVRELFGIPEPAKQFREPVIVGQTVTPIDAFEPTNDDDGKRGARSASALKGAATRARRQAVVASGGDRRTITGRVTYDTAGFAQAVVRPGSAWNDDDLGRAADVLACDAAELVLCQKCDRAVRPSTQKCPGPGCQSSRFRAPTTFRNVAALMPGKGRKRGKRVRIAPPIV